MKQFISLQVLLALLICTPSLIAVPDHTTVPKLTVIFVIDQFAHHYLNTLSSHLRYGIKTMIKKGIFYDSAYMPHGIPSTGPGHTTLNTGAYPKDHGIIGNKWRNKNGTKIACDDDSNPECAVISPNGVYNYGKSPHHIMVNGLSDAFALASTPSAIHHVYSVSAKSRAAICTANKVGKAVWLDQETGLFTSSKYYFDQLPTWLKDFNAKSTIPFMKNYTWHLAYKYNKRAYNFYDINNYLYSRPQKSFIGKNYVMDSNNKALFYEYLEKTPCMADITLSVARSCVNAHVSREKKDKMILWVCISNLDKIGHTFGCSSLEALDTIYHLDKQIEEFMRFAQKKVGDKNVLFVLTADHGMALTPEIAKNRGLTKSNRVLREQLVTECNDTIEKNFNVKDSICAISGPNIYFTPDIMDTLPIEKHNALLQHTKRLLEKKSYIKNIWTYKELVNASFCCNNAIECAFKNQLFPGRSGSIIFQTYPNNFVTTYDKGADHKTPYEYDTHIPMIIYQPGRFEGKTVYKKVYGQQLSGTLSTILRVPKPDIYPFEILPGIFDLNGEID